MRVIYKYPLEVTAEQVINIPMLYFDDRVARCNEQVLHVDVQDVIRPCLWCMVDTENQTYPMKVVTKMTGEEIRERQAEICWLVSHRRWRFRGSCVRMLRIKLRFYKEKML